MVLDVAKQFTFAISAPDELLAWKLVS